MYTFIIVDDEALIRRGMLKKIQKADTGGLLEFAGEADNGEDGLELIRRVDPDIVITDMRMPEMDGKMFLKVLQQDYPEKKIIVVSGHSDFEYMKEAISAKVIGYLLKPFSREEIQETLSKAIQLIEAERSTRQQMEYSELEKEQISCSADMQSMYSLILGLYHKDKAPVLRSAKLQPLMEAACFVLLTCFMPGKLERSPELGQHTLYIPHEQSEHMGFVVQYGREEDQGLLDCDKPWAERILSCFPKGTLLGISHVKPSLKLLTEAYDETVAALNGRSIAGADGPVTFYNGELPSADVIGWEKMDELLFFIESGHAEKVREWTDKLFHHFISTPDASLMTVKNTCGVLIHEVRGMLHRYFSSVDNTSASSSFDAMLAVSYDLSTLKAYMLQVLPSIADMLSEQTVYSSEHVVQNVKTYIEKNYSKELTLEKISSLFFINPSYFSHLYKEKTGVNFIDYVNQVRIDKAKALLRGTDDKVYKVAKALGYDNAKYFFRVFKKLTGCTPEEYRLQAAEQSKEADA